MFRKIGTHCRERFWIRELRWFSHFFNTYLPFIKNHDMKCMCMKIRYQTTQFICKIVFSLVSAIMGTPADVVKARVMNQPMDANGKGLLYRGSIDCLNKTLKNEGFFGLYKGFLPCWLRMAPWSITFWLSFEQIRKLFGAKSWGT